MKRFIGFFCLAILITAWPFTAQAQINKPPAGCSLSVNPISTGMGSGGGEISITVTASNSNCSWNATSLTSWLSISSGGSGAGSGTVKIAVSGNTSAGLRTGKLKIADKSITVRQTGCTFGVSPMQKTVSSNAGTDSLSVSTGASCPWTAKSNAAWITISPASASKTGNNQLHFSVRDNPSAANRTGTITVAEKKVSITQTGQTSCSLSVNPISTGMGSSGGEISITVTASNTSCPWSATSLTSWISVSSGGSGTGNGTVKIAVSGNTSTVLRTGKLKLADKYITVRQSGCVFNVSPMQKTISSSAGADSVSVSTGAACPWTARSNTSWITISPASASKTGSSQMLFSVKANPGAASRTGTITVAGKTVTITQNK